MDVSQPPRDAGADDEAEFLDRFFDGAVDALQRGEEVSFAALVPGREHLAAQVGRLADLARAITGTDVETLPRYDGFTIVAELGRGGMAAVYLARQERLGGRPVALKVLPPHLAHSPGARARFRTEILALARQRHPHVVAPYDVIDQGSGLAYTMEWIDGRSLEQVIERLREDGTNAKRMALVRELLGTPDMQCLEPSYWAFTARLGAEIARALESVHATGILHRDLKPGNVLITREGSAKLSDFGLARLAESATVPLTAEFAGTAAYAPPEQLRGAREALDARSDVYSLGATLYHALALRPPFVGSSPEQVLLRLGEGRCTPLARVDPSIPAELGAIVAKAMEPAPDARFASAGALADALEAFVRGEPVAIRAPGRRAGPGRLPSWRALLAGLVVLAAAAWAVHWSRGTAPDGARTLAKLLGKPVRLEDPQGERGDLFGAALDGAGAHLIVGAPGTDVVRGTDRAHGAGSATIFRRAGRDWSPEARLTAPEPDAGEAFGGAVLVRGDVAVVGAEGARAGEVSGAGAAYVFRNFAGQWTCAARLVSPSAFAGQGFGHCLALSGNVLVVGSAFRSPERGRGVVRADGAALAAVFLLEAERVRLVAVLRPEELRFDDYPFTSCAAAEEGDLVVLGAGFANTLAAGAGAVFVYRRDPADRERWSLVQTLAPELHANANLGCSVALLPEVDGSGSMLLCAATGLRDGDVGGAGAILSFRFNPAADEWRACGELHPPLPTPWSYFGSRMAACGELLAVVDVPPSASGGQTSSAFLCRRIAGGGVERWSLLAHDGLVRPACDYSAHPLALALWPAEEPVGSAWLAVGAALEEGPAPAGREERGVAWLWNAPERTPTR